MTEVLIQKKVVPQKLMKPCSTLMGRTGAGKTTLFNKICNTSRKAGEGGSSVTRDLFVHDISYGDYAASIIDTPGTNSREEAYKHAFLLRAALTAKPLNAIFVIMKFENRFDLMVDFFLEQQEFVYKYDKKIVLMISHWDMAKDPISSFKEICEKFDGICSNIIAYSEKSDTKTLANYMFACASNLPSETLDIPKEDFFLRFNVADMKAKILKEFRMFKKEAEYLSQDYHSGIADLSGLPPSEKNEIIRLVIIQFKNDLDQMLEEFQQKLGGDMQELDFYTFSIKMQKEHVRMCDSFVEKVNALTTVSLVDDTDPRNLIKICPYCQLIWSKIDSEGCNNTTTCGNRVSSWFDVSSKPWYSYVIKRVRGKKFEWFKNEKPKIDPSLLQKKENGDTSKRMGCGKQIVWKDMQSASDDQICDLFKVKTIDQAKIIIEKEQFIKARDLYEKSINADF